MSGAYYFNGHLRWTLFWENPNCWAAFLACALPLLWAIQSRLRLEVKVKGAALGALIMAYVIEAGVWFLLVKTYSRGGLVAAVAGLAAFFLLEKKNSSEYRVAGSEHEGPSAPLPRRAAAHCNERAPARSVAVADGHYSIPATRYSLLLLFRLALIAALCAAAGFVSRLSPEFVARDRSVLNRLDEWRGALVMIYDSPFRGWGYKLGGMMYQNWYQPLWHETRPIGFVNSYLEVAVEQGAWVLFLVVACACALLLIAVRFRRVSWVAAAGASLVAWLACNLWSSVWLWSGLWILPGIAVGALLATPALGRRVSNRASQATSNRASQATSNRASQATPLHAWRIVGVSLAVGLVVWAGVIVAGHALAKDAPFQARPVARGDAAVVSRRGEGKKAATPLGLGLLYSFLPRVGSFVANPGLEDATPLALNTELWVDAAVTGRYWGKTVRTVLENKECGSFIVYAPWAAAESPQFTVYGSQFTVSGHSRTRRGAAAPRAGRVVYTGFQAALLADEIQGWASRAQADAGQTPAESIIIIHPTVYPPAMNLANANARRVEITVCLPAFDVPVYNLAWRRWAAENGARLVFSPQGGARIDPDQNRGFWRELLFNE